MPVSGVLTSCATPAASRPMAAIFSDSRSCSSRLARSVMSSMTMIQPACAPIGPLERRHREVDEQLALRRRCAGASGTRKSEVPRGRSRRAATSVSTNGRRNSDAERPADGARACHAGERFRAPVPPQHAVVQIDHDQPVGQRLDDAVAELADALRSRWPCLKLAVEPRVLDRRRGLAGHRGEQPHVLAAERLAVRAAADRNHGNRRVVRHARHEAREPGVAPARRLRRREPARRQRIVDDDRLAVHQPRGQRRCRCNRDADAAGWSPLDAHDHEAAAVAARVRQKQRDPIDAERLRDAIDEPLAEPVQVEIAVQIAREAHQRAAVVVAIAVIQPIEAGLDRAPQPRRDQRDDQRREQRPEAAVVLVGARHEARPAAACRRRSRRAAGRPPRRRPAPS